MHPRQDVETVGRQVVTVTLFVFGVTGGDFNEHLTLVLERRGTGGYTLVDEVLVDDPKLLWGEFEGAGQE